MRAVVCVCAFAVLSSCGKAQPSEQTVLAVSARLAQAVTDTATRALTPIDVVRTRLACDAGTADQTITRDGSSYVIETVFNACKRGDDTYSGTLKVTFLSNSNGTITVQLDGSLSYVGATEAGTISFNALKVSYSTTQNGDRVTITSSVSGSYSIGGMTVTVQDKRVTTVSTGGGSGSAGGSAGGSSTAGGTAGSGGGVAMTVTIAGASGITDLAAVGENVYFTGERAASEPAIFSAGATSTSAATVCTGATGTKLAGLVVDGQTAYALQASSAGAVKLVKGAVTGTGSPCAEVATVDAQSFFFGELAPMAKVGDLLVYKATDGSLKGYSLTSNAESVIATPGASTSFFPLILGTGSTGVVAQATGATTAPALKTFTAAGLGETLDAFSKPEFTLVGATALWAVDGSGVVFKSRALTSGATITTGPTANLGIPGRTNLAFCETNDGASGGFAIGKSSDTFAGFYTVGLNTMAPRKVTSQAWDAPVLCAVTPTMLWAVEADFGGSRNLLRFPR